MSRSCRFLLPACVLPLVTGQPVFAHPGDPDSSFGDAGIASIGFPGGDDYGTNFVQQADGRIIVAVATSFGAAGALVLQRHLPDGSLDPSFGEAGTLCVSFGTDDAVTTGWRSWSTGAS
jgi:hypothetical protein